MKEGNVRKRGRDEEQPDDQQKICGATYLRSFLSVFEEDFKHDIDEERVYDVMRELMDEIGIVAAPPPLPASAQVNLPLEYSTEICYVACHSASSSTSCSSKAADACGGDILPDMESVKGVVYCASDSERAIFLEDYYLRENFLEFSCADGVLVNDGCIYNLERVFIDNELGQVDDDVSSQGRFNGDHNDLCNNSSVAASRLDLAQML